MCHSSWGAPPAPHSLIVSKLKTDRGFTTVLVPVFSNTKDVWVRYRIHKPTTLSIIYTSNSPYLFHVPLEKEREAQAHLFSLQSMAPGWNATTAPYCYLDVDLNHHREKLATAAAFVDATDSRYGFSSKDLRLLGGSELSRIHELMATDHEWSSKGTDIQIRPPPSGTRIVVQLYWQIAPLACENFATLCANGSGVSPTGGLECKKTKAPLGECGKPLSYRNSKVHRVVPGFIVQGGDVRIIQ